MFFLLHPTVITTSTDFHRCRSTSALPSRFVSLASRRARLPKNGNLLSWISPPLGRKSSLELPEPRLSCLASQRSLTVENLNHAPAGQLQIN
jgi:hypothetical protein